MKTFKTRLISILLAELLLASSLLPAWASPSDGLRPKGITGRSSSRNAILWALRAMEEQRGAIDPNFGVRDGGGREMIEAIQSLKGANAVVRQAWIDLLKRGADFSRPEDVSLLASLKEYLDRSRRSEGGLLLLEKELEAIGFKGEVAQLELARIKQLTGGHEFAEDGGNRPVAEFAEALGEFAEGLKRWEDESGSWDEATAVSHFQVWSEWVETQRQRFIGWGRGGMMPNSAEAKILEPLMRQFLQLTEEAAELFARHQLDTHPPIGLAHIQVGNFYHFLLEKTDLATGYYDDATPEQREEYFSNPLFQPIRDAWHRTLAVVDSMNESQYYKVMAMLERDPLISNPASVALLAFAETLTLEEALAIYRQATSTYGAGRDGIGRYPGIGPGTLVSQPKDWYDLFTNHLQKVLGLMDLLKMRRQSERLEQKLVHSGRVVIALHFLKEQMRSGALTPARADALYASSERAGDGGGHLKAAPFFQIEPAFETLAGYP